MRTDTRVRHECCGQPVRPGETGRVFSTRLPKRRIAECPDCGIRVRVIVRLERRLSCRLCGKEPASREGVSEGEARVHPSCNPMADPWR